MRQDARQAVPTRLDVQPISPKVAVLLQCCVRHLRVSRMQQLAGDPSSGMLREGRGISCRAWKPVSTGSGRYAGQEQE